MQKQAPLGFVFVPQLSLPPRAGSSCPARTSFLCVPSQACLWPHSIFEPEAASTRNYRLFKQATNTLLRTESGIKGFLLPFSLLFKAGFQKLDFPVLICLCKYG